MDGSSWMTCSSYSARSWRYRRAPRETYRSKNPHQTATPMASQMTTSVRALISALTSAAQPRDVGENHDPRNYPRADALDRSRSRHRDEPRTSDNDQDQQDHRNDIRTAARRRHPRGRLSRRRSTSVADNRLIGDLRGARSTLHGQIMA